MDNEKMQQYITELETSLSAMCRTVMRKRDQMDDCDITRLVDAQTLLNKHRPKNQHTFIIKS